MAKPASREQLKDYALRKLGHPVIEINVSDLQLDDRLDDALQFFADYHFDGVEKAFFRHTITPAEAASGATQGYIEIDVPQNVQSVIRVFSINDNFAENFFDVKYQAVLNDIYEWGHMDLIGYDITRRYYSLLDFMLDPEPRYEFSRVKNKLRIYAQDENFVTGLIVLFEVYAILDPQIYTEIYNDRLLKKYVTALFKHQWGSNLSKYDNIQLPGGNTLNGQQILDSAQQEIEKIEEEVQLKFEEPPGFFVS